MGVTNGRTLIICYRLFSGRLAAGMQD